MKNLVTGGSGYFGSLLTEQLLQRNQQVRVFDLSTTNGLPSTVEMVQGDVLDLESTTKAAQGVDVIYHCVAQVPLVRKKSAFNNVNIQGTENVLKAAKANGVKKVILLSSSAVYGIPKSNPVNESTPVKPLEDYGKSKVTGEQIAKQYSAQGLDVTVIRPRTILGHGRLGIFQLLFEWISEGKNVYLFGNGSNIYQFIHAEDLADACIRAASRPGSTEYNIGTDRFCSMRESIEGLVKHAGTKSKVVGLPAKTAASAMQFLSQLRLLPFAPYHWIMYGENLYFDSSKATRELGWKPKWSNIEMLCQTYDWYLEKGRHIKLDSGMATHRSPVKEGLLKMLKLIS